MPDSTLDQAKALIAEALKLCDQSGRDMAALHIQWAYDLLEEEGLPRRMPEPWDSGCRLQ